MKNKEVVIYAPSYCLSYRDNNRLTDMGLQTTKKAIALFKFLKTDEIYDGKPFLILSTSRPVLWEKEAEIKRQLILNAGLNLDDVVIIPALSDSYDEADKIRKIIGDHSDLKLIVVVEKWYAPRVALSLRMVLPSVEMEIIKVSTKIERQLDTSWLRSFLCNYTSINYVLWNWFFYLITPYMLKRQMRKKERK